MMNKKTDQEFIDKFTEAETLCNNCKFSESLEKYSALLKLHPNHIGVLNNTGLVHEKMGNYGKSVDYYKKCNDLIPGQAILMHNLANSYTRLDRWDDALPLLEKIMDNDFDHEKNSEKYALCLFNTRSNEETAGFINTVISRYPDNQRLNRLLGRSLLNMDAHVAGLKHLQKGSGTIEFHLDGVTYLN